MAGLGSKWFDGKNVLVAVFLCSMSGEATCFPFKLGGVSPLESLPLQWASNWLLAILVSFLYTRTGGIIGDFLATLDMVP